MLTSKEKSDTRRLPMMPIRDVVIFPYMMTPFVVGRESSVRALEDAVAALQLPLHLRARVGGQMRRARGRRCGGARRVGRVRACRRESERQKVGEQARACEKTIFQTVARERLQVEIAELLVRDGADVLARHARARHALVVGCERDRHAASARKLRVRRRCARCTPRTAS